MKKVYFLLALVALTLSSFFALNHYKEAVDILSHEVDPKSQELKLYWKKTNGQKIHNFKTLKSDLEQENKTLVFAMNGGMFTKEFDPLGLYIENGKILKPLNKVQKAYGNFYLQPNGIFYINRDKNATVIQTKDFELNDRISYATQSGPMLVINGAIHTAFRDGSNNLNIRNGVGILPNGNILFAQSKGEINLFDFATFFKNKGCKNALYLDGFVSRTYLPAQGWAQMDGNFGVIIAATTPLIK